MGHFFGNANFSEYIIFAAIYNEKCFVFKAIFLIDNKLLCPGVDFSKVESWVFFIDVLLSILILCGMPVDPRWLSGLSHHLDQSGRQRFA